MKITPRYDGPPIVTLDGGDGPDGDAAVGAACIRQRERLQALLAGLSDDDWRTPSRCEGWSVQDVAAHVDTVNRFWDLSIVAGLGGTPTRALDGFDPKATPAALVEAAGAGSPPPAETLAQFTQGNEALCATIAALEPDQWSTIAEAPAGHLPIRLVVHHALWDSWVHERDIALPLGLPLVEEPDEVLASLRFTAGLGPAFALSKDLASPSTLVLDVTGPDARVVVDVTDRVLVHEGPAADPTIVVKDSAVALLEALSIRAHLSAPVPDEHRWLLTSLGVVFESTPA